MQKDSIIIIIEIVRKVQHENKRSNGQTDRHEHHSVQIHLRAQQILIYTRKLCYRKDYRAMRAI